MHLVDVHSAKVVRSSLDGQIIRKTRRYFQNFHHLQFLCSTSHPVPEHFPSSALAKPSGLIEGRIDMSVAGGEKDYMLLIDWWIDQLMNWFVCCFIIWGIFMGKQGWILTINHPSDPRVNSITKDQMPTNHMQIDAVYMLGPIIQMIIWQYKQWSSEQRPTNFPISQTQIQIPKVSTWQMRVTSLSPLPRSREYCWTGAPSALGFLWNTFGWFLVSISIQFNVKMKKDWNCKFEV